MAGQGRKKEKRKSGSLSVLFCPLDYLHGEKEERIEYRKEGEPQTGLTGLEMSLP